MAAAPKFPFYSLFVGVASAASVVLLGVLVDKTYDVSGTLGSHGERLNTIENSIVRSDQEMAKRFDSLDAALAAVKTDLSKQIDAVSANFSRWDLFLSVLDK